MLDIIGISTDIIDTLFLQSKAFFNSSSEIRNSVRRKPDNSRGYSDYELTKQLLDAKELFDVGPELYTNLSDAAIENQLLDGENFWPSSQYLPNFRSSVESFFNATTKLSSLLMRAVLTNLQCADEANQIMESFNQHTSFLRLNYYPIIDSCVPNSETGGEGNNCREPRSFGVSRHTDSGMLTLLVQHEQSGLEVYSGSKEDRHDGEWVPVDPVPGGITINAGDMLQVWSNDLYKAAEHRVRASRERVRYSAPFFYNPTYDTLVSPLPCASRAKYSAIRWGDFRSRRFAGDYADLGKEIQIEDFRLLS